MSFRLRVLVLVALVAVTAVGATAYLAFRQASEQVSESAEADLATTTMIVERLAEYGSRHGTWEGVPETVRELAGATGLRIKLVTETGVVVTDTDTLQGRTARPVTGIPLFVDSRPRLSLPNSEQTTAFDVTLRAIRQYRADVRFAACLTRSNLEVASSSGEFGVIRYAAGATARDRNADAVRHCEDVYAATDGHAADLDAISFCRTPPVVKLATPATETMAQTEGTHMCLRDAFAKRTSTVAPVPLRVFLGAAGDPGPSLEPGPVAAAAALVALLAVAGTAVLSRRVLRPIATLTAASHRLGEGDLSLRVPARGRDELALLAHSFNRMADSLQRGEERQRRLVADVAHELRTPLANLRGYLEALKDGVLPADRATFTSLLEEAVLQQRIVDDLQELALAEAGALAYHRTTVDLYELLETCRTAHQAAADAAAVTLRVEPGNDPVAVLADPDRLRQAVGNLVANALRATPAGSSITLAATVKGTGQAAITVRDTGVGIAAEDLPHIFDRFWRADAARGRETGGSGLGLAIARQIITDHGGEVAADSTVGVGTTVTITLPAA